MDCSQATLQMAFFPLLLSLPAKRHKLSEGIAAHEVSSTQFLAQIYHFSVLTVKIYH